LEELVEEEMVEEELEVDEELEVPWQQICTT